MRNALLRLSLAALVALLATTPIVHAETPAETPAEIPAETLATLGPVVYLPIVGHEPSTSPDPIEQRVIDLTNQLRAQAGCQPLVYSERLARAARVHSADMANNGFFDHIGSDGSTPSQRIQAAGYKAAMSAENIAAGFSSPEAVVQAWSTSAGHRQNMLNCSLTEIGVGYAYAAGSEYGHYWTEEFGKP